MIEEEVLKDKERHYKNIRATTKTQERKTGKIS